PQEDRKMTTPRITEQLSAIAEILAEYVAPAMLRAAREYDDDIWFECEEPFFNDEFHDDRELERRRDEVDVRWDSEFVRRSRQATAEALASEELEALLHGVVEPMNTCHTEIIGTLQPFGESASPPAEVAEEVG